MVETLNCPQYLFDLVDMCLHIDPSNRPSAIAAIKFIESKTSDDSGS